jgi:hypothetical protein
MITIMLTMTLTKSQPQLIDVTRGVIIADSCQEILTEGRGSVQLSSLLRYLVFKEVKYVADLASKV